MSSAQATSSLAADAPRYGVAAADAYYALNQAGTGAVNVTQIVAGSNVTISPTQGTGVVTINAATQAPGVTAVNGETGNVQFQSTDGSVVITTPGTQTVNLAVPGSVIARTKPTGTGYTNLPQSGGISIALDGSSVTNGDFYSWSISFGLATNNNGVAPAVLNATSTVDVTLTGITTATGSLVNTLQLVNIPLQPLATSLYVPALTVPTVAFYNLSGYGKALATGDIQISFNVFNYDPAATVNQIAANSMSVYLFGTELNLAPVLIA